MNVVPLASGRRGLRLLACHFAALEPDTPSARERLDQTLGAELARKLIFALCGAGEPDRARFAA